MLDYLEIRGLLLPHPWGFDVVGKDVLPVFGNEGIRDPEGGGVVHPVVRAVRVPGEVGRSPQQERPKPLPFHQLPEIQSSGLAAHRSRGSRHVTTSAYSLDKLQVASGLRPACS